MRFDMFVNSTVLKNLNFLIVFNISNSMMSQLFNENKYLNFIVFFNFIAEKKEKNDFFNNFSFVNELYFIESFDFLMTDVHACDENSIFLKILHVFHIVVEFSHAFFFDFLYCFFFILRMRFFFQFLVIL